MIMTTALLYLVLRSKGPWESQFVGVLYLVFAAIRITAVPNNLIF